MGTKQWKHHNILKSEDTKADDQYSSREGWTITWPNDQQWSTKYNTENKRSSNINPLYTENELMYSGDVNNYFPLIVSV